MKIEGIIMHIYRRGVLELLLINRHLVPIFDWFEFPDIQPITCQIAVDLPPTIDLNTIQIIFGCRDKMHRAACFRISTYVVQLAFHFRKL